MTRSQSNPQAESGPWAAERPTATKPDAPVRDMGRPAAEPKAPAAPKAAAAPQAPVAPKAVPQAPAAPAAPAAVPHHRPAVNDPQTRVQNPQAAAELLEVRATTVGALDREAEAVIDQTERAIRLVVAELADMAVLVADQRIEEAGGERVVARVATHRHPFHRRTFVS